MSAGLSVYDVLVLAPLVAADPEHLGVLHAATSDRLMPAVLHDDSYVVGACGEAGLKVLSTSAGVVQWPPRVSSLPAGVTRCVPCHVATGRKRPRSSWLSKSSEEGEGKCAYCHDPLAEHTPAEAQSCRLDIEAVSRDA